MIIIIIKVKDYISKANKSFERIIGKRRRKHISVRRTAKIGVRERGELEGD